MVYDNEQIFEDVLHKSCRSYSDPLFVQDYYLREGHNEKTTSATATFVKYGGRYYACTCRHTHEVAKKRNQTLSMMINNIVFDFSSSTKKGLESTFQNPQERFGENEIDVCIAPMGSNWRFFEQKKRKVAIDLDLWEPPPWKDIKLCAAAGYPDKHKKRIENEVSADMPLIIAEIASDLDQDCLSFTLSSKLENPHGFDFSGISGGPILAIWGENQFRPIGLIYEEGCIFVGPNDILVRGLLMTPERFASWLDKTKLEN